MKMSLIKDQKGLAPIVIILIVSFVSMALAGGGVWYWQSQKANNEKVKLEEQKAGLEKKIQDGSKQLEDQKGELEKLKEESSKKDEAEKVTPEDIVELFYKAKKNKSWVEAKKYLTSKVINAYSGGEAGLKQDVENNTFESYTVKVKGVLSGSTYKLTVSEKIGMENPETGEATTMSIDVPLILVKSGNSWLINSMEVPDGLAKPVIYLYPKEKTDVSVRVNPDGGLTYTEPTYNNGWNVIANPNGSLLLGNKVFPYLFWEGNSFKVKAPKEGFVVKKEFISFFLDITLRIQGLNKKEISDFKEFWVPRMQKKPYYFINFIPQEEIDRIAPLEITPKPDTIIRVLMNFNGLDSPINVSEQKLIHRERSGFAAIEWGGIFEK